MQIRITNTFADGSVVFQQGQILDLPNELAAKFIEDGKATGLPKEERAVLHNRTSIAGFVPQKATRR